MRTDLAQRLCRIGMRLDIVAVNAVKTFRHAAGQLRRDDTRRAPRACARKRQVEQAGNDRLLKELEIQPRYAPVLRGLVRGMREREIAAETGLAENTVGSYRRDLYRLAGVHGRLAFIRWWLKAKKNAREQSFTNTPEPGYPS